MADLAAHYTFPHAGTDESRRLNAERLGPGTKAPDWVVSGQPLAHVHRQQQRLAALPENEVCAHTKIPNTTVYAPG